MSIQLLILGNKTTQLLLAMQNLASILESLCSKIQVAFITYSLYCSLEKNSLVEVTRPEARHLHLHSLQQPQHHVRACTTEACCPTEK